MRRGSGFMPQSAVSTKGAASRKARRWGARQAAPAAKTASAPRTDRTLLSLSAFILFDA